MRYIIHITQQETLSPYVPEGMAVFTLYSAAFEKSNPDFNSDRGDPDIEGWSGMFAPQDLLSAQNNDYDCLRLASFVARSVSRMVDDPDMEYLSFKEAIEDLCSLNTKSETTTPTQIKFSTLGNPKTRMLHWPVGVDFDDLVRQAENEMTRIALTKVASQVPSPTSTSYNNVGPSRSPKF